MSHQEDSAYYSARTAEELQRGDEATSAAAAAIHYDLAYRYGALARARTGTTESALLVAAHRPQKGDSAMHQPVPSASVLGGYAQPVPDDIWAPSVLPESCISRHG